MTATFTPTEQAIETASMLREAANTISPLLPLSAQALRKKATEVLEEDRRAQIDNAISEIPLAAQSAAEVGWGAVKAYKPQLDGAANFADISPTKRLEYYTFAAAVLFGECKECWADARESEQDQIATQLQVPVTESVTEDAEGPNNDDLVAFGEPLIGERFVVKDPWGMGYSTVYRHLVKRDKFVYAENLTISDACGVDIHESQFPAQPIPGRVFNNVSEITDGVDAVVTTEGKVYVRDTKGLWTLAKGGARHFETSGFFSHEFPMQEAFARRVSAGA